MSKTNTENKGMENLFELPVKLINYTIESIQKNTEITLNFYQELEKSNRNLLKGYYEICNTVIPGENKFWELQNDLMEKGFSMTDKAYDNMKGLFNKN